MKKSLVLTAVAALLVGVLAGASYPAYYDSSRKC